MGRHPIPSLLAALVVAITLLESHLSQAQGTGRSLDLDPSVRAAGMARASNAVFWGDPPDLWANPALLAYQQGLRYERSKTRLVPDLTSDVTFEIRRVTWGGGAIALALAGQPLDRLGGSRLSYGTSEGADSAGNPTGPFESFEKIRSWSFGLSLAQLTENAAVLLHRTPVSLSRYADVSFGMSTKDLQMVLAPGTEGSTTARDIGVLVRLSPINSIDGPGDAAWPVRVDASYGWSILSYNDATVIFPSESSPDPVSRHHRQGIAARAALGLPADFRGGLEAHRLGWLIPGFTPLVSLGIANDWTHSTAGDLDAPSTSYDTRALGLELTIANVLSVRQGWYEDKDGDIDDTSSGWSLGLPLGRIASVRYDWARFPECCGLSHIQPRGWTAWMNPLALWPQ